MERKETGRPDAATRLGEFAPAEGELTIADLIAIGTQSSGIERVMPGVVTPVVVDANVLIEDLLRFSDGKHSSLLLAAGLGSARLFVPLSVLREVYEHLPRVAERKSRDIARLREVFSHFYLARIRVVDVSDLQAEDERVTALELDDPDDVDAAKLATLLSPSVLLTADKDLLRHGLGVFHEPIEARTGWTFGAVALQDRGLLIGVMAGGEGSFYGGLFVGEAGVSAAKKVMGNERLMTIGLFVIVGIALVFVSSPKARERANGLLKSVAEVAGDATEAIARGLGHALEMSEEAKRLLEANAVRSLAPQSDLELTARALAVAHPGLTVEQLQVALPSVQNLPLVLASSRIFVEIKPGRWALGNAATAQLAGG